MKIIKAGKKDLKIEDFFKFICTKCSCEFEYNSNDLHYFLDGEDIGDRGVFCPWCGNLNTVIKGKPTEYVYTKNLIVPSYYSQIKKLKKENN